MVEDEVASASHRELRNNSGELLRRVAQGESVLAPGPRSSEELIDEVRGE